MKSVVLIWYKHGGIEQKYSTRILSSDKNMLPLCILEELYIEKHDKIYSMNDKKQFGRGGIIQLTTNRVTLIYILFWPYSIFHIGMEHIITSCVALSIVSPDDDVVI